MTTAATEMQGALNKGFGLLQVFVQAKKDEQDAVDKQQQAASAANSTAKAAIDRANKTRAVSVNKAEEIRDAKLQEAEAERQEAAVVTAKALEALNANKETTGIDLLALVQQRTGGGKTSL